MKYTAVIRTLGTAGEKYQKELDSLCNQTIKPTEIFVYIAEGYQIPQETCGIERYIYVKKGMVAQRALNYDEVTTEWILFLDDDLVFPPNFVEQLYNALQTNNADVIAPNIYPNHLRALKSELFMTISGRMMARRYDSKFGYKVMSTAGFSYNQYPPTDGGTLISQTNAGACFLCKKKDFLKINFKDELWIDKQTYPIGEDQIMYYKMYLLGVKQLTIYDTGIEHLDAGNNLGNNEKERKIVLSDYFFRKVFFQRFLYEPEKSALRRIWRLICIKYFFTFGKLVSLLKGDFEMYKLKREAIANANKFLSSDEYKALPKIEQI